MWECGYLMEWPKISPPRTLTQFTLQNLNRLYTKTFVVKISYWCVLNYADSLCIKISPIFYIAQANPNPAGPSMPQYGNYPKFLSMGKIFIHAF